MLKLLSITRDYGACTHIRLRQIAREIKEKKLAKVWQFDVSQNLPEAHKIFMDGAHQADLIWFGRSVSQDTLSIVEELQNMGKKFLFDLDDYIFDVSPWSSHYDAFGTEEVYIDGRAVWKDKVNINIPRNKARREEYHKLLRSIGALSVTTQVLMDQYKEYANKIYVFPNTVNMEEWNWGRPVSRDPDRVRILWQGGVSHYEDFWELEHVIPEITRKYPQVQWVMHGAAWDVFWKDVPKSAHEYHPWVHIEGYPYALKLLGADIGIAPLRDTQFNRGKSSIKHYEHAAMGIPTVASNMSPYSDDIVDGKTGYLASSPDEWVEKLSRLIEDPVERGRIGGEARRYVERERSVEVVTPLIVKAMESFVNGKGLVK